MKFTAGAILVLIARVLVFVGALEIYLLYTGEISFKEGRELKIEYGVLFILTGIALSYISWRWFADTQVGWSQIPHQSFAIVAAIVALATVFEIFSNYAQLNNYIVFIVSTFIAGSWWYRAKSKNT
ncbi:hypothetical protein L1F30_01630 [Simiduia sp. 21SJ11W-1]|uniref:hypothetical protein n=1 Tax=Simiduia sp. 21SJ11W-1 TaxID=2909669 RepID=UPI00209DB8A0|nr:hypothetical protein [Simiduia sp. 21SJ11W-1]UTA48254.1 hypothetical protein L1F30_01630 [Simiduia sp. 21SJ11W-1]